MVISYFIFIWLCNKTIQFQHIISTKIEDKYGWMYWYKYIYYPTYNRLDGLLVGVSIAGIYQFLPAFWRKISKYGNIFIFLGLIVLTSAYFLCYDQMSFNSSIFGFPLIAVGYGFMVVGAVSPSSFLYKWNSKVTTLIATLSYAMYLSHKGIINITHKLLSDFKIENNLMLIICMVACISFAYLLHLIIEKPFMKLRNKIIGQKYSISS